MQALDGGGWLASQYAGESILTLRKCLSLGRRRINFYLDCKRAYEERLIADGLQVEMERQTVVRGKSDLQKKARQLSEGKVLIMAQWSPGDDLDQRISRLSPDAVEAVTIPQVR